MGYRSTFITDQKYVELPEWFVEKYEGSLNFGDIDGKPGYPLSSKWERKFYQNTDEELFLDIAKTLKPGEGVYADAVFLSLLHEDGQMSRVVITHSKITITHLDTHSSVFNGQLGDDGGEREIK